MNEVAADKPRRALLDVNVLIALFNPSHVHHEIAHDWFGDHRASGWATCAITENGFLAVYLRDETLFEPSLIVSHRQLTDVYLLGLATRMGGMLATFDAGIPLKVVKGATAETLAVIAAA